MFGIQLLSTNNINDFTIANYIWDDLCSKTWTWQELDKKYKPLRNKLMTEFRKVSAKA